MKRVLIAEDDAISRRLLEATLRRADYDVVVTENGDQALQALQQSGAPRIAVLDWVMPDLDGIEVCRRVRQQSEYVYVILLTGRGNRDDRVTGFDAGVDDYLTKPFDPHELLSRLAVGRRLLELQSELEAKVGELQEALRHVNQLQGLIPICMHCKKIRDDDATWHRLETYIQAHSDAMFTHSLCHGCLREHYPDFEKKVALKDKAAK